MPKLTSSGDGDRPTSRITPEKEKNQRELPMKSKRQPWWSSGFTPSALGRRSSRDAIVPRMADVASTAVNSDTSTRHPA